MRNLLLFVRMPKLEPSFNHCKVKILLSDSVWMHKMRQTWVQANNYWVHNARLLSLSFCLTGQVENLIIHLSRILIGNFVSFQFVVSSAQYAHYVFNAIDRDSNGSVSFEVIKRRRFHYRCSTPQHRILAINSTLRDSVACSICDENSNTEKIYEGALNN